MIELNLSPSKKAGSITNVAGIDLSLINVKMMFFALIIWFAPEPILVDMWNEEIQSYQAQFQKLNTSYKSLQKDVRKMQNVQKQVDALKEQEQKLAKKLNTVKKIINKRQNPFLILKYIAENIPPEVWLQSITLKNKNLELKGYAKSYKNIGSFINSLKSSIFFQQVNYESANDLQAKSKDQRLEVFKIKTQVVRFK